MKNYFLSFFVLIALSIQSSGASANNFYSSLEGEWYGEGFNVHFGEYRAYWKTTKSLDQRILLKGNLLIESKSNVDQKMEYALTVKSYQHSFGDGVFLVSEQIQSNNELITYNVKLNGPKNELSGWVMIKTEESEFSKGLRVVLEKKGLTFGFMDSEIYCIQEQDFCISDTYSPFIVQRIR